MSRTPIPNRVIYSTFSNELDIHPISGDILQLKNENSVKQSIKNLIFTDLGERLFQPSIGGDIRRLLFENSTAQTILVAKEKIFNVIRDFEPRADCREVNIFVDEERNSVIINVIFSVINIQEPLNLEIILERVR